MLNTMASDSPSPDGAARPARQRAWLWYGLGGLLALLLLMAGTAVFTVWWIQRPIKPVVLSRKEKTVLDQKLESVESPEMTRQKNPTPPSGTARRDLVELPGSIDLPPAPPESYAAGGKELRLTEREINGLLNVNTDLGRTVRLQFERDAINAYLAVPIPQDFPLGGGKMFRARGRFRVSIGNGSQPLAVLEDITVFGVSLPQAWLAGLKGENLLSDALRAKASGRPLLQGIKSLRIEPGALVLELRD